MADSTISIQIGYSAKQAADGVEKIVKSLQKLPPNVTKAITRLNSFRRVITETSGDVDSLTTGVTALGISMGAIPKSVSKVTEEAKAATKETKSLSIATGEAKASVEKFSIVKPFNKMKDSFKRLKTELKDTVSTTKVSGEAFKKLLSSISRVAFYRLIRSGIKAVTDSFREGIKNVYAYSEALGVLDSARVKDNMDNIATSALYVKNALGAMLGPVIQMLTPLLYNLANAFVTVVNAINQFFAALAGNTTFTKAKRYVTEYNNEVKSASGSVSEFKRQILGFDEINKLTEPSGGGGGGAAEALDYSQMFEEANIAANKFTSTLKNISDKIRNEFIPSLKITFKDVVFKWKGANGEQIAEKVITLLSTITGAATGFAIGGVPGAVVGALTGAGLGLTFASFSVDHNGVLGKDEVLGMVKSAALGLIGGAIGLVVGGVNGAALGATVGVSLSLLLGDADFLPNGSITGIAFLGLLVAATKSLIGIKAGTSVLGLTAAEAGIAITALAGLSIILMTISDIKNGEATSAFKVMAGIAEAAMGAVGGIIGFVALHGAAGAILGITVMAALSVLINEMDWNFTPQSKRQLEEGANVVDLAASQAYINSKNGVTTVVKPSEQNDVVKKKADGGYVSTGGLFFAGEAGPELVGQVNGRTNVTNQEQFTAGMEGIMNNTNSIILRAASLIVDAYNKKDMTVNVGLSDRDIYTANKRGAFQLGTAMVK